MKKMFIKTYGCQMNVYDSDKIAELLKPLGYIGTEDPVDADLYVLNTCHIREKAEHKVFSDLGRIRDHSQGRETVIIVAGCVAQAEGEEIRRQAPYVDIVVGPQSYHQLPKMLRSKGRDWINTEFPLESKFDFLPIPEKSSVSAFLSIQEGCDKFCTYCVVPYTRGAEYSRSMPEILDEAKILVDGGAKEITLLGQNVNAYHGLTPQGTVAGLGALIYELSQINGLLRIRYTTSHPKDMDDELIQAHGSIEKLMPFLHLPVQSGSNRILKAMNRQHTIDLYDDVIARLRSIRPDMGFSSDFIVGFPGETDEDFEETLKLVERIQFAQAYSFAFSARPGTPAASMENQVPDSVKSERLARLQELLRTQQLGFNQSKEGRTLPILFEKEGRHENQWIGRTPYMQSVYVTMQDIVPGSVFPCLLENAGINSIRGVMAQ